MFQPGLARHIDNYQPARMGVRANRNLALRPVLSQANFVYFEVEGAKALYQGLLRQGVIVRPMGDKALRVTTGTDEETERFLRAYRALGNTGNK